MNFSFFNEKPIAIIQVSLNNQSEQIPVYKNDNITEVAKQFCEKYDIASDHVPQMRAMIEAEIKRKQRVEPSEASVAEINRQQRVEPSEVATGNTAGIRTVAPEQVALTPVQTEKQAAQAQQYEKWFQLIKKKQDELESHRALLNHSRPSLRKRTSISPISARATMVGKPQFGFKTFHNKRKLTRQPKPQPNRKQQDPVPSKTKQVEFLKRQQDTLAQKQIKLNELRRQRSLPIDQSTGQRFFQPQITKDDIYRQVKKKSDDADRSLVNMLRGVPMVKVASLHTEVVTAQPQYTISKLEHIFKQLDSDNDGRISATEINLAGIESEDLTAISKVLFDLEDRNGVMTLAQFLKQCSDLITDEPALIQQSQSMVEPVRESPIPKRYKKLMEQHMI